jgi:type II secretory pathway pseudopilin PulG
MVELLVSTTIIGLALSLMTGSFSSALIGSHIARNTTAAEVIIQSELDQVRARTYDASAVSFSECFSTSGGEAPATGGFPGSCSASDLYRADVARLADPQPNVQRWSVTVQTWPQPRPIVPAVDVFKDNR